MSTQPHYSRVQVWSLRLKYMGLVARTVIRVFGIVAQQRESDVRLGRVMVTGIPDQRR